MDGPVDGPAGAFAKLAALNPTAPPTKPSAKPGASGAAPSGAVERTVVILRPDAVRRALIAEICKRFERRGLSLVAMKMLKPGGDLASKHYSPLLAFCSRSEVADAANAIASEPCVVTCWKGASAVSAVLAMVGDDDPAAALPGTIRGDLCLAAADSLVECADTAEEAACYLAWVKERDHSDWENGIPPKLTVRKPRLKKPAQSAQPAEAAAPRAEPRMPLATTMAMPINFPMAHAPFLAASPLPMPPLGYMAPFHSAM